MKHIFRACLAFAFLVLLSACLVPEKFTCDILIKADDSYSLTYKGTVIATIALEEIAQSGKTSKDGEYVSEELMNETFKNKSGVKKYSYIGNGRSEIEYSLTETDGKPIIFFNENIWFFTVLKTTKDVVQVTCNGIQEIDWSLVAKSGYKIDGVVTITSELPVIDAAGFEVQKKGGGLFGGKTTYVIRQVIKAVPEKPSVFIFGTK